jgi:hypothetical protein
MWTMVILDRVSLQIAHTKMDKLIRQVFVET